MIRNILTAGLWVSIGIVAGRLLGFFREVTLAAKFGISSDTDIAVLTLTIPDLLVNFLVAGGLSAALIPEFKSRNKKESGALFVQTSFLVFVFFSGFSLVLNFLSPWVVYFFAPGMGDAVAQTAQGVLRGVFWLIPLTVLAGVSTAFLQAQDHFFVPAFGTVFFNASIILGLIYFVDSKHWVASLVVFILLGGILRWFSQVYVLKDSISLKGNFKEVLLTKDMFHRYWQAVTAIGVLSLYPVVFRSLSSLGGDGQISIVNFAFRIVELPLGVVITVLSVVLFPRLSGLYEKGDVVSYSSTLKEGVYWSALLASAFAGIMAGGGGVITSVAFQWGIMTSEDIDYIAIVMKIIALSLPFQAIIVMLIAGFNARKNTKTPMLLSLVGLVILIPLMHVCISSNSLPGGAWVLVLVYMVVGLLFLFNRDESYMGKMFPITLVVLSIMVIAVNYWLSGLLANIFGDSSYVVFMLWAGLVVIVPFGASMFFQRYRRLVLSFF